MAYGAIVIGEAHQHTVATDLLPILLKGLQRKGDLRIIIMSDTIDADLLLNFFLGSLLETFSGREHKVLVSYIAEPPAEDTIVELSVETR